MLKDHVYEIQITQDGRTSYHPAYTCGHCTSVVLIRPDRARERKICFSCGRIICESSEICNTHCTPLYDLAKDHFEGAKEFGKYVPAIMQGITSPKEAQEKGLVNSF